MTAAVDNCWALLLGFVLAFYRQQDVLRRFELRVLALLSWLALVLGLVFLLLLPLGVTNTLRLYRDVSQQSVETLSTRQQQYRSAQQQLNRELSAREQQQIAQRFGIDPSEVGNVQANFAQRLEREQRTFTRRLHQETRDRQRQLLENGARVSLGTLLAGVIFLVIWRQTLWARRSARLRR